MTVPESRAYEYVQDRRYVGELSDPTVIGHASLDGQPPHVTLHLRIEDGVIRDGRFGASGCGYLIAACGALIELVRNRSVDDSRTITDQQVVDHLRGLPDHRRYCAALATAALRDALSTPPPESRAPLQR